MKIAKVIPLYKSGKKVLQITGQYLYYHNPQKLHNNSMDMFIDKCNILSQSQYGFISSMSTTEALIDLVEEITTSLETHKYTV